MTKRSDKGAAVGALATGALAYLRVSTDKQGAAGLGIEAQRAAVRAWADQRGTTLLREFVEVESGRRADRPQLAEALAHARRTRAVLVVAKLDRLTRDVGLLQTLQGAGARVAFCDLPEADGPLGEMLPLLMAWVAQLEARMISHRTRAALAQAKERGQRLGNPNGAAALLRYHEGRKARREPHEGTARAAELARQRTADLAAVIAEVTHECASAQGGAPSQGTRDAVGQSPRAAPSLRAIAGELNRRGVTAPRGGQWHPAGVARVLRAVRALEGLE